MKIQNLFNIICFIQQFSTSESRVLLNLGLRFENFDSFQLEKAKKNLNLKLLDKQK